VTIESEAASARPWQSRLDTNDVSRAIAARGGLDPTGFFERNDSMRIFLALSLIMLASAEDSGALRWLASLARAVKKTTRWRLRSTTMPR
jgi:hypothetical protein